MWMYIKTAFKFFFYSWVICLIYLGVTKYLEYIKTLETGNTRQLYLFLGISVGVAVIMAMLHYLGHLLSQAEVADKKEKIAKQDDKENTKEA